MVYQNEDVGGRAAWCWSTGDGVFRVAGAPETERASVSAAMLEAGPTAVVSHASAAAIWGVPGFTALPAEITAPGRPGKGGRPRLATVHQPRCLLDWHWIDADGLRVTTPTRTLFDLAGLPSVHPKRLERALDRLWAQGRVDHRSLRRMLACLAKRGRPGITLMRGLVNTRGEFYRPPESGAEGRFRELAVSWGYRSFEQQRDLGDENRWIGRVDFVDMQAGIVVEVDPAPFHTSLLDVAHDSERREQLRAAGLQVISVTERELFHAPAELRRLLAAAYRHARGAA
jgi:very-short-patch-repair endonuclease